MTGLQPSASRPASSAQLGMVRIQQGVAPAGALAGSQERYVWPVHLPGWLAMGWRVASHPVASHPVASNEMLPPAAAEATAASVRSQETPTAMEQAAEPPAKGRRGRHRKEAPAEPTAPVAEAAATIQAEETEALNLDPTASPDPALDSSAQPPPIPADSGVELTELDEPTALPDDLFDAPI